MKSCSHGYIDALRLEELWIHTGTTCNLACPFCLEGSKPGDTRLGLVGFEEARPFLDEAAALGVERFSFTGGEPFVNKQLVRILDYALELGPCLVLTNGTLPLRRRFSELMPLLGKPHPLRFRISLDAPDPARHDEGRGEGGFALATRSLHDLQQAGFGVSVARLASRGEDPAAVEAAYAPFVPAGVRFVAFPDFHGPGASPQGLPVITEDCMTRYHTAESRARFMCAFSRMVVKKDGRMRVYACTLVDDDERFDLGATLRESLQRVRLSHHRCFSCFSCGASCSEG